MSGERPNVSPPNVGPCPFILWIFWASLYILGKAERAIPEAPLPPKNHKKNALRASSGSVTVEDINDDDDDNNNSDDIDD
mmetsp:Transcript_42357/g.102061  ORF Transcript_42357/g.102061 Transcript_42357/m.102061 type:complete len:80 (-) Transcript_42357:706-945(-)